MTATTPTMKPQPWQRDWLSMHEAFASRAKSGPIDLLFLGDSITQAWAGDGRAVWDARYAPLNAANFGIGGDETQNILWRLEHGEVDGIAPKIVVLMIGTNNLGNSGHPAADTAAGVAAVVDVLKRKLPTAKILLLAIFPRDAQPGTPFRRQILQVNETISKISGVTFLDIGEKFLAADGSIPADLMPDALHLSPRGYQIWADAMGPTLARLTGPR